MWHPFVSGRMSRADAIADLIEHMERRGRVWFAPLEAIAEHVRHAVAGGWTPRVDRLPYYDRPVEGVRTGPYQAEEETGRHRALRGTGGAALVPAELALRSSRPAPASSPR